MLDLLLGTQFAWMVPVALLVHFLCSVLDAAIPQPVAGSKWAVPRKIITYIAANVGHATNRELCPRCKGELYPAPTAAGPLAGGPGPSVPFFNYPGEHK